MVQSRLLQITSKGLRAGGCCNLIQLGGPGGWCVGGERQRDGCQGYNWGEEISRVDTDWLY